MDRASLGQDQAQIAQAKKAGDLDALRDFDSRALRQVMGDFATGVVVVSCDTENGPMAMTVNAFTSVSLDPPLVLVSLATKARMMAHLEMGKPFSISILGEGQSEVASHFGGKPDQEIIEPLAQACDVPVVREAAAYIGCAVSDMVPQGDHVLIIGRVEWLCRDAECGVLVFHRGCFGGLG